MVASAGWALGYAIRHSLLLSLVLLLVHSSCSGEPSTDKLALSLA